MLTNNGNGEVKDGVIGLLILRDVNSPEYHSIRINQHFEGFSRSKTILVYIDPSIRAGWPQRIEGLSYSNGFLVPAVSDLDKDGEKEIIVARPGFPQEIIVYRANGEIYWRRNINDYYSMEYYSTTPLVGDINGDGYDEVVAYSAYSSTYYRAMNSELKAFSHDGLLLWSKSLLFDWTPAILISDLDNDGRKEIIIKQSSTQPYITSYITIMNGYGEIIRSWNMQNIENLQYGVAVGNFDHINFNLEIVIEESGIAVGNFDDDLDLEIVIANGENFGSNNELSQIIIYNSDGTVVPGWPKIMFKGNHYSSVMGDINSDGLEEVIMTARDYPPDINKPEGIYAWTKEGNIVSGFPKLVEGEASIVIITDIDQDGKTDLISNSYDFDSYTHSIDKARSSLYVWNLNTALGYSSWSLSHHDVQRTSCYDCDISTRQGSMLINEGYEPISGTLKMRVEKYVDGSWLLDRVVINEPKTLESGEILNLGLLWNAQDVRISQSGRYRVHVEFDYGSGIKSYNWEFNVVEGENS